jgi:hypothetical protein
VVVGLRDGELVMSNPKFALLGGVILMVLGSVLRYEAAHMLLWVGAVVIVLVALHICVED